MSKIIRDAYERAILEINPIPEFMACEHYETCLKKIAGVFGKSLEDILENFSLSANKNNIDIDTFLIGWVIRECLPKNSLYQRDLVMVSQHHGSYHYTEKSYRVHILSQKENLKRQDPMWVWENKELVDKFMAIDNPYYKKLKTVEALFPIEILLL